jgi:hypothetical protein
MTLSSPNDVILLRPFYPRALLSAQCALPLDLYPPQCLRVMSLPGSPPKCGRAETFALTGGSADDTKGNIKWDLINTSSCLLARRVYRSDVSHAERVARSDPTSDSPWTAAVVRLFLSPLAIRATALVLFHASHTRSSSTALFSTTMLTRTLTARNAAAPASVTGGEHNCKLCGLL